MSLFNKPKSEMTPEELQKQVEEEFNTGPLSVLTVSQEQYPSAYQFCLNNKKLLDNVKAFHRYCNMVLENMKEMWTEVPQERQGKKSKPVNKDCYISKMFLCGDSVMVILQNLLIAGKKALSPTPNNLLPHPAKAYSTFPFIQRFLSL
ncbi:small nuclear ribonucleoprotein Sm D2-like [Nycticebus coucang]|uniref:small nuclear ribonucleoprotein Sm D2-like n=1 Tax=Nycticebus coucang TaxID=9470 RepID=UPI00234DDBD0|nr:small nuclear ribonucleoprotein Sm D2-like [Nycticebus coucang]